MSLINDMLKDLEKRRSNDLETSSSLNQNITWETRPNKKTFNWKIYLSVFVGLFLLAGISYLLWERTTLVSQTNLNNTKKIAVKKKVKNIARDKNDFSKKLIKPIEVAKVVEKNYEEAIDLEEIDNSELSPVKKVHRPLNNKQLAEIAYTKGYHFLQQGRMRQGKEALHEALSLYIPHIKAREMLAGIYIKSGHFINAAELLSEGAKISPEYPLFAKLYARVLLEQNNPALAIKVLEQGSAIIEQEPDYFALLAATYQRVKKHKKATDLYLQLVKISPASGIWWLGLGISLEKLGKNKTALEAYERANKTGSLNAGLMKFTNNRVSALKEIGFPDDH